MVCLLWLLQRFSTVKLPFSLFNKHSVRIYFETINTHPSLNFPYSLIFQYRYMSSYLIYHYLFWCSNCSKFGQWGIHFELDSESFWHNSMILWHIFTFLHKKMTYFHLVLFHNPTLEFIISPMSPASLRMVFRDQELCARFAISMKNENCLHWYLLIQIHQHSLF